MKRFILSVFLLFAFAAPGFALTQVQFPDQRFPGQGIPQQDPITALERQQIAQETLMILRDTLNVLRETEGMEPGDMRRLEDLSARLDFLISRQQELAMRERMGR